MTVPDRAPPNAHNNLAQNAGTGALAILAIGTWRTPASMLPACLCTHDLIGSAYQQRARVRQYGRLRDGAEEADHAFGKQAGRRFVVGGQAVVGEQVLIAWVQESSACSTLDTSSLAASRSPSVTKNSSASMP